MYAGDGREMEDDDDDDDDETEGEERGGKQIQTSHGQKPVERGIARNPIYLPFNRVLGSGDPIDRIGQVVVRISLVG